MKELQGNINRSSTLDVEFWILEWHFLMANYGWFSKDEFFNMDCSDVDDLIKVNQEVIKRRNNK